MKKLIAALFAFIFIFVAFTSTALAGSAPSAMSYFSSKAYNKTFVDDQGITHTVKASQVSEVWNKAGSILYIIETKETYTDTDGNDHIIVKDDSKIYSNACPKYPDNSHQTVYRVEWYPDGHSTVIYDYRPASTPTPKATPKPTARPTVRPTAKPTPKPTATPTIRPTTTPAESPVATLEPTATPTETPVTTSSPSPELTPSPTPQVTESAAALQVTSTPAGSMLPSEVVSTEDNQEASLPYPIWIMVLAGMICIGFIIFLFMSRHIRKERRKDG